MDELPNDARRRGFRRLYRRILPAVAALLVLVTLVWAVGVEEVQVVLSGIHPRDAAVLVLNGVLPFVVWGVELRLVLEGIGELVGTVRAVELFAASGFLNNVTPLGELGGDPPSALLIAGDRRTSFERGLAAITSLNAINRVAVVAIGVTGVAWLGAGDDGRSALTVVAAGTAFVGVLAAGWVYRRPIVERIGAPIAVAVVWICQWIPLVRAPTQAAVEERVRGFVDAVERLAADPRRVLGSFVLGSAGHLAAATTLWLAVRSLGARVPPEDVLVVVPLAKSSGLSPTPGGAGAATALLAGLLMALTDVDAATATGAALLYRTAAFWVPTALGGAITVRLVSGVLPE